MIVVEELITVMSDVTLIRIVYVNAGRESHIWITALDNSVVRSDTFPATNFSGL